MVLFVRMSSSKVHIQTIGILVAEKSELQTALQYTQQAARQKTGVCVCVCLGEGDFIFLNNKLGNGLSLQQLTVCMCVPLSPCMCVCMHVKLRQRS